MKTSVGAEGIAARRRWIAISMGGLLAASLVACDGSGDGSGAGAAGGGGAGASSTSGSAASSGSGGGSTEVPTSGPELFEYLKAGAYLGFPAESAPHASTGPHGGKVRTFLTPSLQDSLKAGDPEHPTHAAAIKELYLGGSAVAGWAVMVKTQASSDGGNGWYWYEIYSATDPSSPVADGNGVPLCYNCHASGKDYFRSPFPLQ